MPNWFINTLLLEAAGFILVVTGCFVAGMASEALKVTEAKEKERKRVATKQFARMFTEADRRKREAELKKQSSTVLGDTNESAWELCSRGVLSVNEARERMRQPTVFYADDVPYVIMDGARYRITRFMVDGPDVIEYPPYGTVERK